MKKAALITGASSGIGAATALEFSQQGYFVYLMGRNKERLQEVALKCRAGAAVLSCDLTDLAAVDKRLLEVTGNQLYKLQVLVNNAGIYEAQTTSDSTDESWLKQFTVNLFGPVHLTRALLPYFKKQGGGSIVNVSSTLGLRPTLQTPAYSASKAAMVSWTQSMAQELGSSKIRVNVICPGLVDTPIHSFHSQEASQKQKTLESLSSLQPLGRIGSPEEIAKAIFFLGSEQSAWTTGATLSVDGGIYLA
jgi:NAD(P)-dependent dehydrogenase (short-subunit alcohol dehydrogenase family)